jgi:hypothetical protein
MAIGVGAGGVAKCDKCGEIVKFSLESPTVDSVKAALPTVEWELKPDGSVACTKCK